MLMIVSNRLVVGCERRSSGGSRHQLETRKRICRTSQLDASINDKVQFHVYLYACHHIRNPHPSGSSCAFGLAPEPRNTFCRHPAEQTGEANPNDYAVGKPRFVRYPPMRSSQTRSRASEVRNGGQKQEKMNPRPRARFERK